MKQVCIHCERSSSGGNLWCLESYCSVDNKPLVLDYGETLGELTIDKTLAVLHASTLYEADRNGERVLLKVAHPGYQERLKREATFLAGVKHSMLPTLLPAYGQSDVKSYPYGKTVLQGNTLYYKFYGSKADATQLEAYIIDSPHNRLRPQRVTHAKEGGHTTLAKDCLKPRPNDSSFRKPATRSRRWAG